MRPHRHLAAVLRRELRAAGAEVDMERVVPELIDRRPQTADDKRDAVLDLVVSFPGAFMQGWVDVSIRCPHAERYGRADQVPGKAAAKAAEEKHERYGAYVLPLAFETYGRLESAGRLTLEILAAHPWACAKDHWAVQRLVPCAQVVFCFGTCGYLFHSGGCPPGAWSQGERHFCTVGMACSDRVFHSPGGPMNALPHVCGAEQQQQHAETAFAQHLLGPS